MENPHLARKLRMELQKKQKISTKLQAKEVKIIELEEKRKREKLERDLSYDKRKE